MRTAILALLAFAGVSVLSSGPAAARDYRYCLVESRYDFGRCDYDTFAQCQATASGLYAYCQLNPKIAFAERNGPAPRKVRRSHRQQKVQ